MGCCGSKEHVTKPVPEPKKPGAQAPAPVVPTAGQLEITTPAHNTSPEPPAMPPTEEQAAERPAQLKRLATLPEHLRLGVTLAGMRELLLKLCCPERRVGAGQRPDSARQEDGRAQVPNERYVQRLRQPVLHEPLGQGAQGGPDLRPEPTAQRASAASS